MNYKGILTTGGIVATTLLYNPQIVQAGTYNSSNDSSLTAIGFGIGFLGIGMSIATIAILADDNSKQHKEKKDSNLEKKIN